MASAQNSTSACVPSHHAHHQHPVSVDLKPRVRRQLEKLFPGQPALVSDFVLGIEMLEGDRQMVESLGMQRNRPSRVEQQRQLALAAYKAGDIERGQRIRESCVELDTHFFERLDDIRSGAFDHTLSEAIAALSEPYLPSGLDEVRHRPKVVLAQLCLKHGILMVGRNKPYIRLSELIFEQLDDTIERWGFSDAKALRRATQRLLREEFPSPPDQHPIG